MRALTRRALPSLIAHIATDMQTGVGQGATDQSAAWVRECWWEKGKIASGLTGSVRQLGLDRSEGGDGEGRVLDDLKEWDYTIASPTHVLGHQTASVSDTGYRRWSMVRERAFWLCHNGRWREQRLWVPLLGPSVLQRCWRPPQRLSADDNGGSSQRLPRPKPPSDMPLSLLLSWS